jgi:glycosyltransferase involved in cell wall biosynthesis
MLLMGKPLKVLIFSNSPAAPTGYGNQTDIFSRIMKERGHGVIVRGFYGHRGGLMFHGDVPVLPATYDDIAQDVMVSDFERHQPHVLLTLFDVWPYKPEVLRQIPVSAWTPIDHQPAPPQVVNRLQFCKWVWAMSRFGEREMRQAGIDPFYVPHGIDTSVYKPVDRAEARRKWGIDEDRFLVVSNAANKGFPSRKNLDKIIKAWSQFVQKHPTALLYLHTGVSAVTAGYDLIKMVEFYGVPDHTIRFPDQDRYRDGEIHPFMLNDVYNAADVFLLPSAGEGFGIPVIEAQAAGCPVIVTDFSAQTELCGAGYKIPVDRLDDLYYTLQGSEQAWIRPSAIITALEWAVEQRGNMALRAQAREFAMQYDANRVFDRYMQPSLYTMAEGNADWKLTRPMAGKAAA